MWRAFPQQLCEALGARGLVYSRPGYGRSTPRRGDERWLPDFMHRQAHDVLPALLDALAVDVQRERPLLFGHSDGGSIALLYAARWPQHLRGVAVMAPHIRVEDLSISSIERAREAYQTTDLRQRLARHHDDPDSAFWGWNGIWLDPAFRGWSIEAALPGITCPVLALQGLEDEYGTLAQIRGIREHAPQTELVEIPNCGHSPHRDQPEAVIAALQKWWPRT
jgi:pimeloyl-ACP methyl ester carboxylesterase